MKTCSICHLEIIKDNVNPEKILTCAKCVQILLIATQENKISYKNHLLEIGDTESARSIESFITPEEDTTIATFETSYRKHSPKLLLHRSKGVINRSNYRKLR